MGRRNAKTGGGYEQEKGDKSDTDSGIVSSVFGRVDFAFENTSAGDEQREFYSFYFRNNKRILFTVSFLFQAVNYFGVSFKRVFSYYRDYPHVPFFYRSF